MMTMPPIFLASEKTSNKHKVYELYFAVIKQILMCKDIMDFMEHAVLPHACKAPNLDSLNLLYSYVKARRLKAQLSKYNGSV